MIVLSKNDYVDKTNLKWNYCFVKDDYVLKVLAKSTIAINS
jgi:hypothetical protein